MIQLYEGQVSAHSIRKVSLTSYVPLYTDTYIHVYLFKMPKTK